MGSSVVSAPIGLAPMAAAQAGRGAGQQQPEDQQHDRRDRRAERGPADHAAARGAPGQVARVVGGGVDPAEPEAGHHEHQRADELLRRARTGSRATVCQWILSATSPMNTTVSTAGHDRDHRLHPHDQVEAHDAADDGQRGHHDQRDDLRRRCRRPPRGAVNTVAVARVARMISTVSQPTVSSQEITEGSLLPRTPNAARPSTMVGADPRLPATAMNPHSRNETTMPTSPDDDRLPERDAEAEHERAVAQAEHRDVGGEPGPEQVARAALALGVGDHVDAVGLDLQRARLRRPGRSPCPRHHTASHRQLLRAGHSPLPDSTLRRAGRIPARERHPRRRGRASGPRRVDG